MIEWTDASGRHSHFFVGECLEGSELSIADAIRLMVDLLNQELLGKGHAANFEIVMFEVNCDSGRLIAGASTLKGWQASRTDGCSIRLQEVQDYWYDLVEAGLSAEEFAPAIRRKILEVGTMFRDEIASRAESLIAKASKEGFKLIVFGSNPGEELLSDTFR